MMLELPSIARRIVDTVQADLDARLAS